jgi:hypothetical protein
LKTREELKVNKPLTWSLLEEEIERTQKWGVELGLK